MNKVKIVNAQTFKLNPNKRYLMIFEENMITRQGIHEAQEELHSMGFEGLILIIRGNSTDVKVVEQS